MTRSIEQNPVHASAVGVPGQGSSVSGVLILGASGSGKSALALDLISRGAKLVADDRVVLRAEDGVLCAEAPDAIKGRIEARGIGLLQVEALEGCVVRYVVDLDQMPDQRLPAPQTITILGCDLPLIKGAGIPHLAQTLTVLLAGGRLEDVAP